VTQIGAGDWEESSFPLPEASRVALCDVVFVSILYPSNIFDHSNIKHIVYSKLLLAVGWGTTLCPLGERPAAQGTEGRSQYGKSLGDKGQEACSVAVCLKPSLGDLNYLCEF
jgi:hypothetical protein